MLVCGRGLTARILPSRFEQVEKDCDRDNFMTSDEAKSYGLVDEVVQSRKEIPGLIDGKPAEKLL